jgi:beta-galactosidase
MKTFCKKLLVATLFPMLTVFSVSAQSGLKPAEIQVTPYKTTMLANGKDQARITIKLIDKTGKEVADAKKLISIHIKGDARIVHSEKLAIQGAHSDSLWNAYLTGDAEEVKADSLWTGSTEIHTVQTGIPHKVTNEVYTPKETSDKILGADISFLPELEARGIKFSDNGVQKDAIQILKDHGFNYIRLRIFNEPANPKGYSPNKGFCDLEHTMQMAKRVKAAGMKLLLDFHYSDYWADPQQQNKPASWSGEDFTALKQSVQEYTEKVMNALKGQGTSPDMVQIGNEINHGMIWPEGRVNNLDSLAQLIYAGFKGVKAVDPNSIIMLHIALGGQNAESRFFFDNMKARNVPYDGIGLSYYPKWHGTLADLQYNLADLSKRYNRQIMVAEYTQLKKEVNDLAFTVPGGKGVGSFIWEPLSTWEMIFDRSGKSNELINVYQVIAKKYGVK